MNDAIDTLRTRTNAAEWAQRVDLAACYRLVALFGWDDLIFTHISARVPGSEHHFLINPYGMMFDEITASHLVKVDLEGNKVMDSPSPINPAGFTIHSAIHAARADAGCVLHLHSVNGVAVSAQAGGVLPISQHSIFVLSSLAVCVGAVGVPVSAGLASRATVAGIHPSAIFPPESAIGMLDAVGVVVVKDVDTFPSRVV